MSRPQPVIPVEVIASRIYLIRGEKVMLDSDLADLYGVPTSRLNEQFKRNRDRFPVDFAFQLTKDEFASLMSQIAISNTGRGGRRKLPWAFTEHGVAMLSSVLRSKKAVHVNISIFTDVRTAKEDSGYTPGFSSKSRGTRPADRRLAQCGSKTARSAGPGEETPHRLYPSEGLTVVFRRMHYHIGINGGFLPLWSVFVCSCGLDVIVCER